MIIRQRWRAEPEFANAALALDVDVGRFRAIEAVEEQSVRPELTANRRHDS
jgi:hypothetical protein